LVTSSAEEQLKTLPVWAKSILEFNELDLDDQVTLLRTGSYYFFNNFLFLRNVESE
jgi:hypothetical protein